MGVLSILVFGLYLFISTEEFLIKRQLPSKEAVKEVIKALLYAPNNRRINSSDAK